MCEDYGETVVIHRLVGDFSVPIIIQYNLLLSAVDVNSGWFRNAGLENWRRMSK